MGIPRRLKNINSIHILIRSILNQFMKNHHIMLNIIGPQKKNTCPHLYIKTVMIDIIIHLAKNTYLLKESSIMRQRPLMKIQITMSPLQESILLLGSQNI